MEYLTTGNVAMLLIALVVMSIVIPASISDVLLSRRSVRALIQAGKRSSLRPITVVIVLKKRFSSIIPLLDHLYGFRHKKFRVLIISHHSAGKNVRRDVERFKLANKRSNLEVVAHKKGRTLHQEVTTLVKTDLWIKLDESLQLAKRFFELVSYDYRGVSMVPMVQSAISNRLTSLFRAYDVALTNRSVDLRQHYSPALVHSKKNDAVFEPTRAAIILSDQQTFTSYIIQRTLHLTDVLLRFSGVIFLVTVALTLASIIYFDDTENLPVLVLASMILYAIGLYSLQARGVYSLNRRINLLLLLPFKVVLDFILLAISVVVLPIRLIWQLKHRAYYKYNRNNR